MFLQVVDLINCISTPMDISKKQKKQKPLPSIPFLDYIVENANLTPFIRMHRSR